HGRLSSTADIFDLISGTSTGGLIALLLGRVGLSIPEPKRSMSGSQRRFFQSKPTLRTTSLIAGTRRGSEVAP
ncbi:hypothetical protein B0H66DRAFT_550114, partial [Apodospora peruviana]